MKNKVSIFTLILLLVIPVSLFSVQYSQYSIKDNYSERNVILELARLYSPSIRSTNCFVIALKASNSSYIYIDFGFEGQFEITISSNQTEFYNNTISIDLFPNMKNDKLNIPISNLKSGNYIFTIKDLLTQESSSGEFTIK